MAGHTILLNLLGGIALLIWGTSMVRTGVMRSFGSDLRRLLAAATANRLRAAAAGLGAAAALQSATATAMLLAAFVASGMVALGPALAVMLGADLGTTLVAQLLAFDLGAIVPVLLVLGVGLALAGPSDRVRQAGRMVIGFGLMVLALGMIVAASAPMRDSDVLTLVLGRLAADPALALMLAAGLSWLFHSSVAFVLFVMSLAGAGVVSLPLAVSLVLGANLGAGLVPLGLAAGSSVAARRVLYGNLAFRAVGVVIAFALLGPLTELAAALPGTPERQVVHLHSLFNLTLLVVALPLTEPLARLLVAAFPDPAPIPTGRPPHLDLSLIDRPALAITAATREVLAVADSVETMLRQTVPALTTGEPQRIEAVRALEQSVDHAQEALGRYLVRLMRADLSREEQARATELLLFTTNLEHAGDIIDKGLMRTAEKKRRLGVDFSPEGWRDIRAVHTLVLNQMRLALTVLVSRDPETAREIVAEKDRLRDLEAEATERHLARLREGTPASVETSALHLDILRDLKRIVAHLTTVAHPLLEEQGLLRDSRLRGAREAPLDESDFGLAPGRSEAPLTPR